MLRMPSKAVAQWLNKLYVSIIDPERSRDAFRRTDKFHDPSFLEKIDLLSDEVDHFVFDASFAGDLPEIKELIEKAPEDVVDVLVFRFNLRIFELEDQPGDLFFPDKPDILAAFRLFLILDDRIRNAQGPTH